MADKELIRPPFENDYPGISIAGFRFFQQIAGYINSLFSGNGNFVQQGTGAITRTAQSKMQEGFHVTDFGAVGDGTTNDTTAIQAAINAAVALGGSNVIFPQTVSGDYKISSKLTVSGKVLLQGTGQYHTRIYCDDCDGIEIAAGVTGVKINNIEISHAVRYTTTPNTHFGLKFAGSTGSRPFYNIVADTFFDGFGTAIETNWLWSTNFRNVHINYCHVGIYMKGLGCNNTISDCQIKTDGSAGSRGLLLGDGTNASEGLMVQNSLIYYGEENIEAIAFGQSCIMNCIIDYSRKYGIDIRNSATDMCSGWQISNNYIAVEGANGVTCVSLYNDVDHFQNVGNRVIGNYILCYDASTCPKGVVVNGDYGDNNTIMGNVVKDFSDFDISIAKGVGNIVSDNQCLSASPSTASIYAVAGNIVRGNVAIGAVNLATATTSGINGYGSGSGSPSGSVTPKSIGEEYLDTNAEPKKWYKSIGLTNSDWVALN